MKTTLIILGIVLFPMILYLVFALLGFADMGLNKVFDRIALAKTENEAEDEHTVTRTGYSKRRKALRRAILFIVLAIFVATTVFAFVFEGKFAGVAMLILSLAITWIPLFVYLQAELTYEIIEDDGIIVRRITSKKKIKYSDMAYYKAERGMYPEWTDLYVYSESGKRLIRVIDGRIGTQALVNALEAHGIKKEIYWLSDKQGKKHT